MKLSDFKVGDAVVYKPEGVQPGLALEDGIVTSVNDHYVFVRFTGMHPAAPGRACRPEDLIKP